MNPRTETRFLFTLNGPEGFVRGTCHHAAGWEPKSKSAHSGKHEIGIVFLNSLSPTRAWKGDSSVFWADALAERGYLAFRIDLPGFGDSAAEPPPDLTGFINSGGYACCAADLIQQIAARFSLSGIVLVGLCAGAVSAIFTAARSHQCCGLVLLDPYFYLPLTEKPGLPSRLANSIPPGGLRRSIKYVMDCVARARVRLAGPDLPGNTNLPLLSCCLDLVKRGTPIFFLNAAAVLQKGAPFDYLEYILRETAGRNRVVHEAIQGADHTFANQLGRIAVRDRTLRWLAANFVQDASGAPVASPTELAYQPSDVG